MKGCPECKTRLVIRNGKFGEFICCPKGHGTFSIQDGTMYYKGSVGKMFSRDRIETIYRRLELEYIDSGANFAPSLTQLMNAQMASWGWNSGGEMEQLAQFTEGSPETMWDDDERENGDNWWNLRPY